MFKNTHIKSIIALVLTGIHSISHSFGQNKQEYIILSGTIKNIDPQPNGGRTIELKVPFGSNELAKTIYLTNDGSFSDTLRSGSGEYTIWDGKNPVQIYLNTSKKYRISYDADNFRNGIVHLEGNDVPINQYFIDKQQKKVFIDRLNTSRSEKEFRQLIGEIRQQALARLQNARLPKALKLKETKSIRYEYLSELYFFLALKRNTNPEFQPSVESEKELNINYSNEKDYKQFGYYQKLVYEYYMTQLSRIETEQKQINPSYSLTQNTLKLLASIVPDNYIKNDLIAQRAMYEIKEVNDVESYYKDFNTYYTGNDVEFKEKITDAYLRLSQLKTGMSSPEFINYLNYKGGTTSLKDFRGKYVYIDLWATWCGNCWGEMPFLKKLEHDYQDKNIAFVSISLDTDASKWANTIKEKNMGGIQLLVNQADMSFTNEYAVNGIPRYILLDPDGAIVSYSAPRPSETDALNHLFAKLRL